MLRRYEDKAARRRRTVPPPGHAPHVRHGVDFVEICDGGPGAMCIYRPATDAEKAQYRNARVEIK